MDLERAPQVSPLEIVRETNASRRSKGTLPGVPHRSIFHALVRSTPRALSQLDVPRIPASSGDASPRTIAASRESPGLCFCGRRDVVERLSESSRFRRQTRGTGDSLNVLDVA